MKKTLAVIFLLPLLLVLLFAIKEQKIYCHGSGLGVLFRSSCTMPGRLWYTARGKPFHFYRTYFQETDISKTLFGRSDYSNNPGFIYQGLLLNYLFFFLVVGIPYLVFKVIVIIWKYMSKSVKRRK